MRKFYTLFLILPMLLLLAISLSAQEKYHSLIKGRIVDDKGQPVENANISFDVSASLYNKFCWVKDNSVFSDKNGNFIHYEHCGISNRTVFLYIVPPVDDNALITIYPPFDAVRRYNSAFAGLSVSINGNQDVDLGDTPVQVYYNTINLFIFDKTEKPFYKTEDEWGNFALLIRSKNGEFADGTTLSNEDIRKTLDAEKVSIRLTLPEGTWELELLKVLDDYDNETDRAKTILGSTKVTVNKSGKPLAPSQIIVGGKKSN